MERDALGSDSQEFHHEEEQFSRTNQTKEIIALFLPGVEEPLYVEMFAPPEGLRYADVLQPNEIHIFVDKNPEEYRQTLRWMSLAYMDVFGQADGFKEGGTRKIDQQIVPLDTLWKSVVATTMYSTLQPTIDYLASIPPEYSGSYGSEQNLLLMRFLDELPKEAKDALLEESDVLPFYSVGSVVEHMTDLVTPEPGKHPVVAVWGNSQDSSNPVYAF